MSGQVQKERTKSASSEAPQSDVKQGDKSKEARAKAQSESLDELIDEIDELLEDESFVAAYVQKGGE